MPITTQFDPNKPTFKSRRNFTYYLRKLDPIQRRLFLIDNYEHYKHFLEDPNTDWNNDLNLLKHLLFKLSKEDQSKRLQDFAVQTLSGMQLLELLSIDELDILAGQIHDFYLDNVQLIEPMNILINNMDRTSWHYTNPIFGTNNTYARSNKKEKWNNTISIVENRIIDEIYKKQYACTIDNIVEEYILGLQRLIDFGFPLSQKRLNEFRELLFAIDISFNTQTVHNRRPVGTYSAKLHRICVNVDPTIYPPDDFKVLIFHELTHFLSSTNLIANSMNAHSGFSRIRYRFKSQNGQTIIRNKKRHAAETIYNEAITDSIPGWLMVKDLPDFTKMKCKEFFNPPVGPFSIGYPLAKKFCGEILANMPIANMLKAYFEDYKSLSFPGTRYIAHRTHAEDFAKHVKGGYLTFRRKWNAYKKINYKKNITNREQKTEELFKTFKPITTNWNEKVQELEGDFVLVNGHSKHARLLPKNESPAVLRREKYNIAQGERINGEGIVAARIALYDLVL